MKQTVLEFCRRGLVACGFGPLVLAVIYLFLQHQGVVQTLAVDQVCLEIVSLSALAFVAGGMNVIYRMEQLPLMVAILIHGGVLYIWYLLTYLVNNWLEWGAMPILVFSGIFVISYLGIWVVIFFVTQKNTARVNEMLRRKQAAQKAEPGRNE